MAQELEMFGKAYILGLALVSVIAVAGCSGGSIGFIPDDNTDPTLAVFGIADGDAYGTLVPGDDMVEITAVAADEAGIASFTLRINGVLVASSDDGNLAYNWNALGAANGTHTFVFEATDENGNMAQESLEADVTNLIIIPWP